MAFTLQKNKVWLISSTGKPYFSNFPHSLGTMTEMFVNRIPGTDYSFALAKFHLRRNLFYKDFQRGDVFLMNT